MRTSLRMSGKKRIFAGGKNRAKSIRRSQMRKYLTYLLCIVSTIGWAENSFDAFCSKFPLMELPIVSDSRIYGDNLYYFQLDKESSITEEEFEKFIKTSRWGQYQQPGDSLLHIYHYIPTGRAYFKSFIHSIGSLSCLFVFLARNTIRSKNYSGSIWINFQRTKNIL